MIPYSHCYKRGPPTVSGLKFRVRVVYCNFGQRAKIMIQSGCLHVGSDGTT